MFKSGGWIGIGIILIIFGFLLQSNVFALLLDIGGWIIAILGVIAIVLGLVGLIAGNKRGRGGY